MAGKKVVVIGLDGATWNLLKPWADNGELPTIKKLMDEGFWGNLESTIPPITGPAWTSISTGKNPGKHGIFGFVRLEQGTLKLNRPKDVKSKPIYEILSENGISNIIIGFPLSFPPSGYFEGIITSDFLYPTPSVIPNSKKAYINDYRVAPDFSKKGEELLEDMINTAKSQVELAKALFSNETWDFFFFVFNQTDSVSHHFWNDMVNGTKLGEKAKEVFAIADEFLGWLLNKISDDTILLIVSDHGFESCPYKINLNKLLLDKGFLKTKIKEKKSDETLEQQIKLFGNFGEQIKIPRTLYKLGTNPLMEPISVKIFKHIFKNKETSTVEGIDFEKSKAFVPSSESMCIQLNPELDEKDRENTAKQIIDFLRELGYDGKKVFRCVLSKNEVYSGPFVKSAPEILLLPDGFFITSSFSRCLFDEFNQGSFHDRKGIFLAYGSKIKSGEGGSMRLCDITPTILHIFDLPIPQDMDGEVLKNIFKE